MTSHTHSELGYRPESYWDLAEPYRVLLSRIPGEERKKDARLLLQTGRLGELQEFLFAEQLTERERALVTSVHPTFMGGEYLPPWRGNEVEIARVTLKSVTQDVISIRARLAGGRIRYRIVDEYETVFAFRPRSSARPLTTRQLIDLIDGARHPDYPEPGLTSCFRNYNHRILTEDNWAVEEEAEALVEFVRVTSDFYPLLEGYYIAEAAEWLDVIRERCRDEEDDEAWDEDEVDRDGRLA